MNSAAAAPTNAPASGTLAKEPTQQRWDDTELERLVRESPSRLGSMSLGKPNAGALFNAVQLTEDAFFVPVDQDNAWGTRETLDYLRSAARAVHEKFPESPRLHVGHISARRGGRLSPHRSHQSGRDVDIAFYYQGKNQWYRRATPENLDLARTWTFIRALITETDIEMILMDGRLGSALRRYAAGLGEDPGWLTSIFKHTRGSRAIVRHASGHSTHMHLRFYNPRAQPLGRRAYPLLVQHELIDKVKIYRYHRVKRGETLGKLAKRYGTTVRAIKRANGLKTTVIQAKKLYKIPTRANRPLLEAPFAVPPRRLPPESTTPTEGG